jgi:hypothetical protein
MVRTGPFGLLQTYRRNVCRSDSCDTHLSIPLYERAEVVRSKHEGGAKGLLGGDLRAETLDRPFDMSAFGFIPEIFTALIMSALDSAAFEIRFA